MSSISAGTTIGTGVRITSDTSGSLLLKTGASATTAVDIDAAQVVSIGNIAVTGGTVDGTVVGGTTAAAGSFTTLTTASTVTVNNGTANGVTYLNGSKALTSGSVMSFDGTTLTTGAHSLSTGVLTVPAGSASTPSITTTGDTNTGIFFPAADTIAFGEGGVESLRLNSAGKLVYTSSALGTASAGLSEYDGLSMYFTPVGTQRGVVPGMQYYVLNASLVGANATGAQSILGVGVTLNSSTTYAFECAFNFFKTAGTTSHTFSFGFGGTATLTGITSNVLLSESANGYVTPTRTANIYAPETAAATVLTGNINQAFYTVNLIIKGIVRVNVGGTFIPQYSLSAAPGGAYTSSARNYMSIWPIGSNTGNISVGAWA